MMRAPFSLEKEHEWFENTSRDPNSYFWAATRGSAKGLEGELIGNCGLGGIDWRHRHGSFGFMIGEPDQWGQGLGTEMVQLVLAYAFRELGLEKVCSAVIAPNEASLKAHLRAGFGECGVWRRHLWFRGTWHDECRLEVLREEWEAKHGLAALWPPADSSP